MIQAATAAEASTIQRSRRDLRMGVVVSDKGHKTIRVRFEYVYRHPKYGKSLRRKTILHAHDENNEARVGDVVEVMACRRISRTKSWRLTRVLRRAAG